MMGDGLSGRWKPLTDTQSAVLFGVSARFGLLSDGERRLSAAGIVHSDFVRTTGLLRVLLQHTVWASRGRAVVSYIHCVM